MIRDDTFLESFSNFEFRGYAQEAIGLKMRRPQEAIGLRKALAFRML